MEDITGKQLGPYQIIAPLGEGGMAAVYKAYQPGVEREVALKILPRHFANDPQFVARFEQEAKMLARLQHPHILPVFDFGEAEDYTYIVMPLLKNGDLNDLMKVKPLPLEQIRRITTQVGDALAYAHQQGLIHRDVKPSNVLLDESGNCLLTDFGIAKLVESSVNLTATGGIVGTPTYMSPEQGLGKKLDGRSDIYSLGIIMYEMATGRVPYRAETPMAVVVKHINDPLPPPRQVNSNIPEALEKVILKAVAKKPEDRYQSAAELVKAVKKAIPEGGSIAPDTIFTPSVPTIETPEVEETEKKDSTKMVWGLVIAAVLLVGLGLLVIAGAGAIFIVGGNSGREDVTRVAEITTIPLATATPAQPVPTKSPTTPPQPIEVPEAATTSPPTATPTPLPIMPDAEPGMACVGSFGLGISCLDETGMWRTYTEEDSSLGSNLVYAMAACPNQRMAIAHAFGVSMFDGQNWTEYEGPPGVTSPSAMACDARGGLWMTHYSGVSYFDGTNWTTHTSDKFAADADPKALVDDIAVASDGSVWVSTSNSIARFDGSEWEVFQEGSGFDDRYFFDGVVVDNRDRPWALYGGGVFEYDGEKWIEHKNRDLLISKSIAVANNNEVWVGTYSEGIRVFNGQGGWYTLDSKNSKLTSNQVPVMMVDGRGRLWLATNWGLNVVDGEDWQTYHMHNAGLIDDSNIRAIAIAGLGPTLPEPVEKAPGALRGRLVTPGGNPIANAALEVCVTRINERFTGETPCAEQPYMLQTTTDADGNFALTEVPAGYYRLVVNDSQTGWIILDESASSLEDEQVLVEAGEETDLLQIIVSPDE